MKKLNKTSKLKTRRKPVRLKLNPWEDDSVIEKKLDKLIDEHVILQTARWVNYPKPVNNRINRLVIFKFYGILKNSLYEDRYNNPYIFRYNPLNQWKYEKLEQLKEKIKPIPRTNRKPEYLDLPNEFYGEVLNDAEFLNDDPTYEFEFNINKVLEVEKNIIQLYDDIAGSSSPPVFHPKPIPDFGIWGN